MAIVIYDIFFVNSFWDKAALFPVRNDAHALESFIQWWAVGMYLIWWCVQVGKARFFNLDLEDCSGILELRNLVAIMKIRVKNAILFLLKEQ